MVYEEFPCYLVPSLLDSVVAVLVTHIRILVLQNTGTRPSIALRN
jgi:hypothetical protein